MTLFLSGNEITSLPDLISRDCATQIILFYICKMFRTYAHESYVSTSTLSAYTKAASRSTGCLDNPNFVSMQPTPLGKSLDYLPKLGTSPRSLEPGYNSRDELMPCTKRPGEVRPTVMIHYMPHRTFETPILCTCIPPVKVIRNKRHSTGSIADENRNIRHSTAYSRDSRRVKMSKSVANISSVNNTKRVWFNPSPMPYIQKQAKTTTCDSRVFNVSHLGHSTFDFSQFDLKEKRKSSSLKKKLLKPLKMLKRKFIKKTVNLQESVVNEPCCRFSVVDKDFPYAFV